jgi:hypothetical protein
LAANRIRGYKRRSVGLCHKVYRKNEMTPDFYRKVVNPDCKNFKHLYLAVAEQPNGIRGGRTNFDVYWPENSLTAAKKVMKSWAGGLTQRGTCVRIISVVEIKESTKNGRDRNNS